MLYRTLINPTIEGIGDQPIEETECFVSEDESEAEFEGDGELVSPRQRDRLLLLIPVHQHA